MFCSDENWISLQPPIGNRDQRQLLLVVPPERLIEAKLQRNEMLLREGEPVCVFSDFQRLKLMLHYVFVHQKNSAPS